MVRLSSGEKRFIEDGIAQDLRIDGRKRLTYRPIVVKTGGNLQADGSATVKIGNTEVIVTVKAKLGTPTASAPHQGKVSFDINFSTTAGPEFEGRGGDKLSMELSTALRVCLLGGISGAGSGIELSSLSIVDGKICWDLDIKGLVISMDGDVLDALGAAVKAALSNTRIPKVNVPSATSCDEQPEPVVSHDEVLQFDTTAIPVIVTVMNVGWHRIVDATSEEESASMGSAVSFAINRRGRICGVMKRGSAGLDPSVIDDMRSVAKFVSESLMTRLDSLIAAAEAQKRSRDC